MEGVIWGGCCVVVVLRLFTHRRGHIINEVETTTPYWDVVSIDYQVRQERAITALQS